jgi:hypothetical protein
MSFFVKCPKQMPVQGRFKKVQMYGAIEDKDMVPFGLEQFGLETCRRAHVESLTAERLRAERRYIPIIRTRARDLVSRA